MKILKGWRTRIYAALQFVPGLVVAIEPNVLQAVSSDQPSIRHFGYLLMGQGTVSYVLRQLTNTAAGNR